MTTGSPDGSSVEGCRQRYIDLLPTDQMASIVSVVERDLADMPLEEQASYILRCVPNVLLASECAGSLRRILSPQDRVALALAQARAGNVQRTLLDEAAELVNALPPGTELRRIFWNGALRYVEFEGVLWEHAPTHHREMLERAREAGRTAVPFETLRGSVRANMNAVRPRHADGQERSSPVDDWFRIDWCAKFEHQPLAKVLSDLDIAARRIRDERERSRCVGSLPDTLLLHPDARSLRLLLTEEERASVLCRVVMGAKITHSQLSFFIEGISALSIDVAVRAWLEAIERSPHREHLRSAIPRSLESRLLWHIHSEYLKLLAQVRPFDEPHYVMCDAELLCRELTEDDRKLARLWAGTSANGYEYAKMLSARMAEHAAMRYYRGMAHSVEDVAVGQLHGASNDWKTHDLLLDGARAIDVKNSRTTVNSGGGYSEHAVPRFKAHREAAPVIVTGVRSPYLKLDDILEPERIYYYCLPVHVLGECSRDALGSLRREFVSDQLTDITFKRGGPMSNGASQDVEFLPPWVFDSPPRLYGGESAKRYRSAVLELCGIESPELRVMARLGLNAVPLCLQSESGLPAAWRGSLDEWVVSFADELVSRVDGSLPRLFLMLLTDFLDAVVSRRPVFQPTAYRVLLYPCTSSESGYDEPQWHKMPLGIYDPLGSVAALLTTLEIPWEHRDVNSLRDFVEFQFSGAALLRGRRRHDLTRITLVAYCGGLTNGRGRCGNSPLVLGAHKTCGVCGYLICEVCGHCSDRCRDAALQDHDPEANQAFPES